MWDLVIRHDNITKKQLTKLKNIAAYYYVNLRYLFYRFPKVLKNYLFN